MQIVLTNKTRRESMSRFGSRLVLRMFIGKLGT